MHSITKSLIGNFWLANHNSNSYPLNLYIIMNKCICFICSVQIGIINDQSLVARKAVEMITEENVDVILGSPSTRRKVLSLN